MGAYISCSAGYEYCHYYATLPGNIPTVRYIRTLVETATEYTLNRFAVYYYISELPECQYKRSIDKAHTMW